MGDAAGSVKVVLSVDAASYSAALDKANAKIRQFGQAAEQAGHASVNSMQASSAAIRTLEGGMQNNIRAAERFISTIPGIGEALKAAFPVVGALAFAGVLAKVGQEVYKFIDAANKVPKAIEQGFQAMALSQRSATAALDVTNDKLENQIAKLEHKPQNNIKLAIDEARVAADKFAESLATANKNVAALLKEQSVGMIGGYLTGQASTSKLAGTVNSYNQQLSDLGDKRSIAVDSGDTNEAAEIKKQIDDVRAAYKRAMQAELAKGDSVGGFWNNEDNTANQRIARGALSSEMGQERQEQSEATNKQDESTLAADKEKAENAKEAAEAAKKANADLYNAMKEGLAQQKAQYGMSIADELNYWSQRTSAFQKGSEQYHAIQMEQMNLQSALYKQMQDGKKKYLEETNKSTVEGNDLLAGGAKALNGVSSAEYERGLESARKYNEEVAKGSEIAAHNAQSMQEAAIAIDLQNGTITKLAAAQQLATIHANEHAAALKAINDELATQIQLINSDDKLTPTDKTNAIRNATQSSNNQAAVLNGQYAVTSAQDASAINSNTISGAMTNSINKMVDDWTNASQQIVGLFQDSVNKFNDTLDNIITGKGHGTARQQLKGAVGGMFADASDRGIKGAEGMAMKALGFGGGKKVSHVIVDNMPAAGIGGAGGAGGPGASSLPQSPVSTALHKAGNFISKLFGGGGAAPGSGAQNLRDLQLTSASGSWDLDTDLSDVGLPMLAGGGDVDADSPAIIGEKGPELFVPHTAGRVVPNGKFGGNVTHHHIAVDARGAHDPAATEAAVHRAMSRYMPAAVGASVSAVQDRNRRVPLTKR